MSVSLDDGPEEYLRGVVSQVRGVQDGGAVRFTYDIDGGPHVHGMFFVLEVRTGSCFLRFAHGGDWANGDPRDQVRPDRRWSDLALAGGGWDGEHEMRRSLSATPYGHVVDGGHVIRIGKPADGLEAGDLRQALASLMAAKVMSA